MAELILYSNKQSRGRAVHWLLEEMGLPYQATWLDFGPPMKQAEYLAINPMGKVPALKHGDAVITETAAILTYLADTFPDKAMMPAAGSPDRASFYRWMFFIAGPLEAATTAEFLGWQTPDKTPLGTPCQAFLGFGSLPLTLNTLESHLNQHAYVVGEHFTAADIYLATHLNFGMRYTKAYPPREVFNEYLNRMLHRPAKLRVDAL
jgi:glutathione S-transferase